MTTYAATTTTRNRLATTCFALGLVAALLTTTLAFLSLALGAVALVCGVVSARRAGLGVTIAAGLAMAATSIYVIVLEIFVLGG